MVLEEIGTLLEIHGENKFKARAFFNAARVIEKLERDIVELTRAGELPQVEGIGPATANVVRDLVETGRSRYYDDLRERTPDGMLELLGVPGLGPGRIRTLHEKLGIKSLQDLERAAHEGRIASVQGFGARTQQKILEGIGYVRSTTGRRRMPECIDVAHRLSAFVAALPAVEEALVVGELRRGCETVDGIDILARVSRNGMSDVLRAFLELPGVARSERAGETRAVATLSDGLQLRLECAPPEAFAATSIFATGSGAHVQKLREIAEARGFELRQDGLFRDHTRVPARSEEDIYAALGLSFVEPELREDGSELAVSAGGTLPRLITYDDLRGCFHCHTTYSDGRASVAEMAEAAHERGWRYLGIADHSQHASYAGGLSVDDVRRQHDEIDEWNESNGRRVWLFKGIEADILSDGTLDYADAEGVLDSFDYVIGSVHSSFNLPPDAMTQRFLRAIENPYLTMLGHPTGRLLLSRAEYRFDIDQVLEAAGRRGVAVEINADPHRLDLDWRYWRTALRFGVRCAINPDAHSARALGYVHYGITMARKGWLEAKDVVNAWTLPAVRKFLQKSQA